jgi:hypothetical protein
MTGNKLPLAKDQKFGGFLGFGGHMVAIPDDKFNHPQTAKSNCVRALRRSISSSR